MPASERRHDAPAVPLATYRLQLTKDFGFDDAAALVPYLKELGISHLYASPFLKARPGSTHGYDIVDHDRLNPELGGEEGFARLSRRRSSNTSSASSSISCPTTWASAMPTMPGGSTCWNGARSRLTPRLSTSIGRRCRYRRHPGVLLPILGRPYGEALQSGEIELRYDAADGSFAAWYFDHKLPINPQRYDEMLRTIVGAAAAR